MFQLYDILRFHSTVLINVLINISSPKLNNQFFSKFKLYAHGMRLVRFLSACV